jgi:iron complex transport system substrate-binding protein
MLRPKTGAIACLVVLVLFAAACAPVPTPVPPTTTPTRQRPTVAPTAIPVTATPTATAAPTATPIGSVTVVDDANRTVTIPSAPQRILSLAPSTTEIAFALGLGSRMAAVDPFSDYPPEAKNLPKVNNSPLNLEQVVALKPDLVLAAGITSGEDVKKMVNLQLPVIVVGATKTTLESIMADIRLVGQATGTELKAKTVTDGMKQRLDAVQAKLAGAQTKPRVYWELDATDPAKPFTPGPGSFLDEIIRLAGGTNVAANAKSPYAQVNAEEVIAENPDIIILSDFAYGTTIESVKARPGWLAINAVKNDKVFPIDDNLVSRPSPRIVEGLEAAAKLIHPEFFP